VNRRSAFFQISTNCWYRIAATCRSALALALFERQRVRGSLWRAHRLPAGETAISGFGCRSPPIVPLAHLQPRRGPQIGAFETRVSTRRDSNPIPLRWCCPEQWLPSTGEKNVANQCVCRPPVPGAHLCKAGPVSPHNAGASATSGPLPAE